MHDFVGLVEERVGHGLPDADAGDAADHIVQALDVLDVERREHVDARRQQLVDVLPALRVPRSGDVGMRELVDQDRATDGACQRRVEIELGQPLALVLEHLRAAGRRQARSSASVSLRPCVSRRPTTTSLPSLRRARAAVSIAYVLPTPAEAPK